MTAGNSAPVLLPHVRGPEDFGRAFAVSPSTLARLEVYAATLRLWQQRINLVSPNTMDDLWHRHMADSAQLLDLAPANFLTWADFGSGAGFPGLVVAIMLAGDELPGRRMILVESDQRKCAFLGEVVRQTGISAIMPVDILCARVEQPATRAKLATVDVVSARALASFDRLLELSVPWMGAATVGLFPKGRNAAVEIAEAERRWQFAYDLAESRTDAEARIVRVRGAAVLAEG